MEIWLILLALLLIVGVDVTVTAGFNNNPTTTSFYEDNNSGATVWAIGATCTEKYSYSQASGYTRQSCNYDESGDLQCSTVSETRYHTMYSSRDASCTSCSVSVSPSSNIFYMDGFSVKRYACTDTNCRTCTAQGCFTYDSASSYSLSVSCEHSSWPAQAISHTFTVTITENTAPVWNSGDYGVGFEAANTIVHDPDVTDNEGDADYYFETAPGAAYLTGNTLWAIDPSNGDISTTMDLNMEYSQYFHYRVCANDRRNTVCQDVQLTLTACFEIPTCYNNNNLGMDDTFAVGNELLTVSWPAPSAHFPDFSADWQGIGFSIASNNGGLPISIDNSGVIISTGNFSVHPYYPHRDYTVETEISNTASCGRKSICTMSFRVAFYNWPIEIRSLISGTLEYSNPAYIHEDTDGKTAVHHLITYDYNNIAHDNVTCEVTSVDDASLLDLELSAASDRTIVSPHRMYTVYKQQCGQYDCGFDCPFNIGCMNYDKISSYDIVIRCFDGYGSEDTRTFTLNIQPNQPPVFTDLPTTVILDTDATANTDIIFEIRYTDAENEFMYYNYTETPASADYFLKDPSGNYHNSRANISLTEHGWDIATNETYDLYICATERRNMVCSTLTVEFNNNCGPVPSCTDDSTTITDQFSQGGTVFTVASSTPAGGTVTYSITPSDTFAISSSGVITTLVSLTSGIPQTGKTFFLTVTVRDSEACKHATCSFTVYVTFTNFPINIVNIPATANIHEDRTTEKSLILVQTSDTNTDDTVTCSINDAASSPANTGKFKTEETYTGSNQWTVMSIDNPGFDYSVQSSYTVKVKCEDYLGSSDEEDLTVNIDENQIQTFVGLDANAGHSLEFDINSLTNGQTLYTVVTSDAEGDAITHTCSVANSYVPFYCNSDGTIYLRRLVGTSEEDTTYQITMFATDSVHSYQISIVFSIKFVIANQSPVIDDPPTNLSFDENDATITTIYTVTVTDANGDSTTVQMVVDPASATSIFSLDSNTHVLSLVSGNTFDYETQTSYTFTFSSYDGQAYAETNKSLTIAVNNVNEAPSFTLDTTDISVIEGPTTTFLSILSYTCTDVDQNDNVHISLVGSTFFNLNPTTANLTYSSEYDLESGDPTSVTLTVACTDNGGLSQQATLRVNVAGLNEFDPVPQDTSVTLSISSDTKITDVLHTITYTDNDYGDDGVFDISVMGVGLGAQYFTVNSNGELKIKAAIDLTEDKLFSFTVIASDGESSPRYGFVDFNVSYTSTYVPAMPTRQTVCTTCSTEGRIVLAFLIIEGVVILGCITHLIIHFCRAHNICRGPSQVKAFSRTIEASNPEANGNNRNNNNNNRNNNNNNRNNEDRRRNRPRNSEDSTNDYSDESISSASDIDEESPRSVVDNEGALPEDPIYAHQHLNEPYRNPSFPNPVMV